MDSRLEDHSGSILVIEDDPLLRTVLLNTLSAAGGYRVAGVGTGTEGLAAYFERRPDAVLLDISLPDMNGLDILRRFCLLEERTPILVLTGLVEESLEQSCLELGATAVIHKPVRSEVLRQVLQQALSV